MSNNKNPVLNETALTFTIKEDFSYRAITEAIYEASLEQYGYVISFSPSKKNEGLILHVTVKSFCLPVSAVSTINTVIKCLYATGITRHMNTKLSIKSCPVSSESEQAIDVAIEIAEINFLEELKKNNG